MAKKAPPTREEMREQKRQSRAKLKAADPEGYLEKQREYATRHRAKDPEAYRKSVRKRTAKYRAGLGKKARSEANRRHLATWKQRNPVKYLLNCIKKRAKTKGIPFDLEPGDLVVPERCPALGIELVFSNTPGGEPNSPSVDRIVPEKGYVKGNIIVISKLANQIKSSATSDQVAKVARWMAGMDGME